MPAYPFGHSCFYNQSLASYELIYKKVLQSLPVSFGTMRHLNKQAHV